MARYAVFGNPILHSKSPQLFSPLLNDQDTYTRIRPQSPEDLIRVVKFLNIIGSSITAPYKESILPFLDHLTDAAAEVGAVNCIRNDDGRLTGHNTDAFGVTDALKEAGINPADSKILVLGAGGAARAAVYGLCKEGAEVFVSNRTSSKAEALAKRFGAKAVDWEQPGTLPYFDAIVSALLPEAIPPFIGYICYGWMLDAVYKRSEMQRHSLRRGAKIIEGTRWLIYQGIAAAKFYLPGQFSGFNAETIANETFEVAFTEKASRLTANERALAKAMEVSLNTVVSKECLSVYALNSKSLSSFDSGHHDIAISAFGYNDQTINKIRNEEIRLAFGD